MTLTLFIVTFVSAASLGFVDEITREPKALALLAKKREKITQILPSFDNDPLSEMYALTDSDGNTLTCYQAKKDGVLVGIAIETYSTKGFGGTITVMVGFLPDGTIYDSTVIEHSETPGLGDKLQPNRSAFSSQFKGKIPGAFVLLIKKDGGDIDGITAATISSRAYCDAIKRAYDIYKEAGVPSI